MAEDRSPATQLSLCTGERPCVAASSSPPPHQRSESCEIFRGRGKGDVLLFDLIKATDMTVHCSASLPGGWGLWESRFQVGFFGRLLWFRREWQVLIYLEKVCSFIWWYFYSFGILGNANMLNYIFARSFSKSIFKNCTFSRFRSLFEWIDNRIFFDLSALLATL